MNYRDIYSQYPELATRLVRTSPQFNQIASIGNCNLDLSIKEMKFLINGTAKRAIFHLSEPGQGEGPGVYFEAIVFMSMPGYDTLNDKGSVYMWMYDAGASLTEEHGDYHMLTMDNTRMNANLINDKDALIRVIEAEQGLDVKTFDVKSLYQLYHRRQSCRQFPNYAKIKTKALFNSMVNRFSEHDATILLNLYLMVNYIVLDLDLSVAFMTAQTKMSVQGEMAYDYEQYVEDTALDRQIMINTIIDTINQF